MSKILESIRLDEEKQGRDYSLTVIFKDIYDGKTPCKNDIGAAIKLRKGDSAPSIILQFRRLADDLERYIIANNK